MNPVNLYATPSGDFAPAASLTVEEALAVRNQLSPDEILNDLSADARAAVLDSYGMRGRTPQGDLVIVWNVPPRVVEEASQP